MKLKNVLLKVFYIVIQSFIYIWVHTGIKLRDNFELLTFENYYDALYTSVERAPTVTTNFQFVKKKRDNGVQMLTVVQSSKKLGNFYCLLGFGANKICTFLLLKNIFCASIALK